MTEQREEISEACVVVGANLRPCQWLEDAVEPPLGRGTRKQGLKFTTFTSRDDLIRGKRYYRSAVVCISGKFPDGIKVEFCPFCGGNIRTEYQRDAVDAAVAEGRT